MYTVTRPLESSVHAHGTEIRGGNLNSLKLPWDSQGNGRFATDSQVCKWLSDGDPRTGTFHQTWPTTGNPACSVKGVLRVTASRIIIM